MQFAIVILDGASGDPVPEFGGKTTLEASKTPNLDSLARQGTVGLVQNVPAHMLSGSDVACLSIMGYDPAMYRIGRGAIESAALGIELKPGQVALRLNLCYVEDGLMKGYSTGNISTEDGKALAEEIKESLDDQVFTLYPGTSFRQVLVAEGYPALAGLAFQTPHDSVGLKAVDASRPKAHNALEEQAAAKLLEYLAAADRILAHSSTNARRIAEGRWPANMAWAFWPGMKPASLKPFSDLYGKTAAVNSAVDLLNGLAMLTGMRTYTFEGVTDGPSNDFAAQGKGAITMLEDGNDVVIIHVEAPDAAGHDGNPDEKKRGIEESDKHILGPLIAYAKEHPLRIAVMPDHPTPLSTRKHSHDRVPFVLSGPGIGCNGISRLTEQEARASGLVLEEGHSFMGKLLLSA